MLTADGTFPSCLEAAEKEPVSMTVLKIINCS